MSLGWASRYYYLKIGKANVTYFYSVRCYDGNRLVYERLEAVGWKWRLNEWRE